MKKPVGKTKIGFFELEGWEHALLKKTFPANSFELFESGGSLQKTSQIPADLEIVSVFVNSKVDEAVLKKLPRLKFLTTRSTGFDHIDTRICKRHQVTMSFVPGYGDNTVAEHAFGLILNLTRRLYEGISRVKETGTFSFTGLRGVDLKGKTLGVIGTGRIGRQAIKIAKGFGMKVVAFDPFPDRSAARKFLFQYVPLTKLLKVSDIITIHAPYNKNTHHLINRTNIKTVKKGAYLINTARGAIVDTAALIMALKSKILSGAGLDVLEEEGDIKDEAHFFKNPHPQAAALKTILYDHLLMRMPNVLITPHNAFNTQEALERIMATTLENIKAFLKGRPINLIS